MDFLNLYFNDHKYPLTSHQLDSYREFLRTHIPNIIKSGNPITMIKPEDQNGIRIDVSIGFNDNIYIDRPIIQNDDKDVLLTPNEARLRNLTYQTNLYADVKIDFYDNDNLEGINFENNENIFKDVYIGSVPIMLHSDACLLHGQNKQVLRELKECMNDYGGYFILDGKEKVIISQERITKNRLFLQKLKDDNLFSHKAYISCIAEQGEGSLHPKRLEFFMYKNPTEIPHFYSGANYISEMGFDDMLDVLSESNAMNAGAVVIRMTKITIPIPIILLFKFLGVNSDEEIYNLIFGSMNEHSQEEINKYMSFLRPCIINANSLTEHKKDFDLVKYIASHPNTGELKENIIRGILYVDLFPNIEEIDGKLKYLGYLTKQFALFTFGYLEETDKDSYFYKRIDVSGFMLSELFNETYELFRKHVRDKIDSIYHYGVWKNKRKKNGSDIDAYKLFMGTGDDIRRLVPAIFLSETFTKSLKGRWGMANSDEYEEGKVQDLSRISYLGYLSHVRRVDIDIDRSLKLFKSHMLHPHQFGIICPYETPDGASIGYLKNLALLAKITAGTPQDDIFKCLESSGCFIPIVDCSGVIINRIKTTVIFLNGTLIGITHTPLKLHKYMKLCKRTGSINILVGIVLDSINNELRILTESGRAMRPLHLVKNNTIDTDQKNKNWFDFLIGNYYPKDKDLHSEDIYTRTGFISPFKSDDETLETVMQKMEERSGTIEYLDVEESDSALIAMFPHQIEKKHTHCEIHPSTMLSVVSVNIPMCNHSFAARNIFHAAQSKQAIGMFATSFNDRFDTMAYLMHYPQKPLVSTKPSFLTGSESMPNGTNIIVAVMAYSGFNQEDSLMINRGAIERGFEKINYYKSVSLSTQTKNSMEKMYFCNPKLLETRGKNIKNMKKSADYSLLDENGFVKKGTLIPQGKDTAVIGCVLERTITKEIQQGMFTKTVNEQEYIDQSLITDDNIYGMVDKVSFLNKTTKDNNMVCKVRFLKVRTPELGDKHSSRHGQKGVIGRIFEEEDMPYTKDGLKPDIIMNSHAFPSRMTIGHVVECVYAKLCCLKGGIGDGTVFVPFDNERMSSDLESFGYNKHGNEILYNGMTGEQIKTDIFIGPVYYFRLKHMVADKINARGYGPKQFLTRQPTAGRRKHGGLRIGEMERDALLGHGLSMFIKESMMERSDNYSMIIDSSKGTPVTKPEIGMVSVNVPYSFKLFSQELETMGIDMRYVIEDKMDFVSTLENEEPVFDENALKQFLDYKIKKPTRKKSTSTKKKKEKDEIIGGERNEDEIQTENEDEIQTENEDEKLSDNDDLKHDLDDVSSVDSGDNANELIPEDDLLILSNSNNKKDNYYHDIDNINDVDVVKDTEDQENDIEDIEDIEDDTVIGGNLENVEIGSQFNNTNNNNVEVVFTE